MKGFISEKVSRWLLPAVLILFLLEIITMPFVVGLTYSGRSESPDHILTYYKGTLTWDSHTDIREDGVACLDFFDAIHYHVVSSGFDNVMAPGTEGTNVVRLANDASGPITYTAVLFEVKTSDLLPVNAQMIDREEFSSTTKYWLPEGVREQDVIKVVTGDVGGGMVVDFDVYWYWPFEQSEIRDMVDTGLGNKAFADQAIVGLYIVVEDDNVYEEPETPDDPIDPVDPVDPDDPDDPITPEPPGTSDSTIGAYIVLMIISFAVLVLLIVDRCMAKKCEK